MGDQLTFGSIAPEFSRFNTGEALIRLASEVVDYFGPKKVAADLGRRNHAAIAYAVKDEQKARRGHRLYIEEVAYFREAHPDQRRAELLILGDSAPISDADRLTEILLALDDYLGPELRKGFLAKVNKGLLRRRRRAG